MRGPLILTAGLTGLVLLVSSCGKAPEDYTNLIDVPKQEISYSQLSDEQVYKTALKLEEEAMRGRTTAKSYHDDKWLPIAQKLISAAARYDWLTEKSTNPEIKRQAQERLNNLYIDPIAQEFDGHAMELGDILLVFKDKKARSRDSDDYIGMLVTVDAYRIKKYGDKTEYEKIDLSSKNPFSSSKTISLEAEDYNLATIVSN